MDDLQKSRKPSVEMEIHGVGLDCHDCQPNRIRYALETWHTYPDRRMLAAISYHRTRKDAEVIKANEMESMRPKKCQAVKNRWRIGLMAKGYLTLSDQFDTPKEYLNYVRSVSMHPARVDKQIMKMEVRG